MSARQVDDCFHNAQVALDEAEAQWVQCQGFETPGVDSAQIVLNALASVREKLTVTEKAVEERLYRNGE